jgi:hypothetical protein
MGMRHQRQLESKRRRDKRRRRKRRPDFSPYSR